MWDYLGWKDTLADPAQYRALAGYSKSRGDHERYTPQMVVNGAAQRSGATVPRSRRRSQEPPQRSRDVGGGEGSRARRPPDDRAAGRCAGRGRDVSVWGLAKAVTVMITRGENKGRTVTYHNVVRRFVNLGAWNAATNQWSVPLRDIAGDGIEAAAVMVQTGTAEKPSIILGATLASIR